MHEMLSSNSTDTTGRVGLLKSEKTGMLAPGQVSEVVAVLEASVAVVAAARALEVAVALEEVEVALEVGSVVVEQDLAVETSVDHQTIPKLPLFHPTRSPTMPLTAANEAR